MSRRKNHPKKRSPESATPSESETSTPPSPALQATPTPVTEVPPLPVSLPVVALAEATDTSGASVAIEHVPATGLIRSALRWIPILGRFV